MAVSDNRSGYLHPKLSALAELRKSMEQATAVPKRLVWGEGNTQTKLAIVGEAPGRKEEMSGHPFVGPAGELLNKLLDEVSITREDIWITNVVKWRPVDNKNKARTRAPLAGEIDASSLWLRKELEVISPKVILCLGNVAARVVIKKDFQMNQEHGRWYRSVIGSKALATFHPAYVLRQGKNKRNQILDLVRSDLAKVKLEL
jgi:DNA polymerase